MNEQGTGNHLYDTIEPAVIDERLLNAAIEEQGPIGEAGRVAKEEGIAYEDVLELRLDFHNIHEIKNVWCLKNITKLQLDNNIIERIEGLDTLVHLVWLDLSFNNIEVIEGLSKLTRLQFRGIVLSIQVSVKDLTLFHNRISLLEGMDELRQLNVFSIGNNSLTDMDNLIYLRRFEQLRTVNLEGNPLCQQDTYKPFVLAHLPQINYLDYRLVDETERKSACEQYYIQIEELALNERQAKRKQIEEEEKLVEFERHRTAYVENLDADQLFVQLYEGDQEGRKISSMPGLDEIIQSYKEKFCAICQQIFNYGLEKQDERQKEVDLFWKCLEEAKEQNGEEAKRLVAEFNEHREQVFNSVMHVQDNDQVDQLLNEYNNDIMKLWDQLMTLEMQLVDQIEEVCKDFQLSINDMVTNFLEQVKTEAFCCALHRKVLLVKNYTAQLRDLENTHHEKVIELAIVVLEKVLKNEIDDEISDELRDVMVDKDTVTQAVTSSHDYHLLKIDNREDELVQRIHSWMNELFQRINRMEEIKRNRDRVSEIGNLIDHYKEELENIDLSGRAKEHNSTD